jgi:hypothetical protein
VTIRKKFPQDVIDLWPEVFGEIDLNVIPIRYLDTITVTFTNQETKEIKLTKIHPDASWIEFEKKLKEVLQTYEKEIDNVDFKLDTERIKKDIIKKTNDFLKRRKIK